MLGLAYALHHAPAFRSAHRLLHEIVVPRMNDERQRGLRRQQAMQRRGLHGGGERFRHRRLDRLAVLEVFDELRRRCQVLADLVRHARLGGEPVDQSFGRGRQRTAFAGERQHARPKIGNDKAAREILADRLNSFKRHVRLRCLRARLAPTIADGCAIAIPSRPSPCPSPHGRGAALTPAATGLPLPWGEG